MRSVVMGGPPRNGQADKTGATTMRCSRERLDSYQRPSPLVVLEQRLRSSRSAGEREGTKAAFRSPPALTEHVRLHALIGGDLGQPFTDEPSPHDRREHGGGHETVALRGRVGAFLPLAKLIELKLASGLSAPHRLKDLADVLELGRAAQLPRELAQELDESVRAKFDELWTAAQTVDPE